MKQYLDLLTRIKNYGCYKPAARANMPSSTSLFGYQFRHNLADGFPILTTKKVSFKNIVIELLWFLRGDTNIKYLIENGLNIWNEDAYNYYCKIACVNNEEVNSILLPISSKMGVRNAHPIFEADGYSMLQFEEFCDMMKKTPKEDLPKYKNYILGDCGHQYGKVWRDWENFIGNNGNAIYFNNIDQIKNLIEGLIKNPESRRHIVTAIDPAHDTNLALYWCHAMFQFNCRPLTMGEKVQWVMKNRDIEMENLAITEEALSKRTPQYYLDCQLYQRSADSFLGVPYNLTSYSLLIEIVAQMCNMISGELVHTFGDVHIYENHDEQTDEQLKRTPTKLPKLLFKDKFHNDIEQFRNENMTISEFINNIEVDSFALEGYNPQEAIKGKLSTGLK